MGGGRHAVGEERLSADAHTWDAFLGCCIQSHEWAAAEAAVGDRTRQGFPLRMERHSWALDAALNARQVRPLCAITAAGLASTTELQDGLASRGWLKAKQVRPTLQYSKLSCPSLHSCYPCSSAVAVPSTADSALRVTLRPCRSGPSHALTFSTRSNVVSG